MCFAVDFVTQKLITMSDQLATMAMRTPMLHSTIRASVIEATERRSDPRQLYGELIHKDPSEIQDSTEQIWRNLYSYSFGNSSKGERPVITDIGKVISLINNANKIVVVLGAGGSVGPDFRSPGGLYDSIAKAGVLPNPCDVFDLQCFQQDPSIFWRFAHTVFPSTNPQYSRAQLFIKELAERGKLLRLYSQNVDALEVGIPSDKLRCVHGSWRETRCMRCGCVHTIEDIRPAVMNGEIPSCHFCNGPLKPGIVFFGEDVNLNEFELAMDAENADLLLVIGTSLRVAPVSEIPNAIPNIPAILINRAPVNCNFSTELLGECDNIIGMLEYELGWEDETTYEATDAMSYNKNKFIFPSESELATRVIETSSSSFLATSVPVDVDDLL